MTTNLVVTLGCNLGTNWYQSVPSVSTYIINFKFFYKSYFYSIESIPYRQKYISIYKNEQNFILFCRLIKIKS